MRIEADELGWKKARKKIKISCCLYHVTNTLGRANGIKKITRENITFIF